MGVASIGPIQRPQTGRGCKNRMAAWTEALPAGSGSVQDCDTEWGWRTCQHLGVPNATVSRGIPQDGADLAALSP